MGVLLIGGTFSVCMFPALGIESWKMAAVSIKVVVPKLFGLAQLGLVLLIVLKKIFTALKKSSSTGLSHWFPILIPTGSN